MKTLNWKFDSEWQAYYTENEVPRDEVEKNVRGILTDAVKGQGWKDSRDMTHYSILKDGEIVGNLWKDADLSNLTAGCYWVGPLGIRVELVADDEVVGMLWLETK